MSSAKSFARYVIHMFVVMAVQIQNNGNTLMPYWYTIPIMRLTQKICATLANWI